ncbi:MAG: 3-phosphoglycerate dehydrogenase [Clostridia bacterium]|nr:3-phosphoglycerate dehydrogenase [Clostridia bacterium]
MKIICVADAYVTEKMMYEGVQPYLNEQDELKVFFFGEQDRRSMRETVKAIEAMKRDELTIPEALYAEIENADVLLVHLCPVTRRLLKNANQLKAVLSCRGGYENIDVEAATEKNIIVATDPAHNANAVAEFTVGLIICETRNIARADASLKAGVWREEYPNTQSSIKEIKDMTVGLIGLGSVGRLVAEKLSAFRCEILVYSPHISESAYDFINYKFVDLNTLLKKSDVVTLHTRSKVPILTDREFDIMKPTAYLINTARSVLVEQNALYRALKEKKIIGAAIDVFESEPVIPDFYREFDNVTLTNHRGGDTINSYKDAPGFALSNYMNYLNGERMRFWINKDHTSM